MEGNLTNLPLPLAIEAASISFFICIVWYFVLKDVINRYPVLGVLLFTFLNFTTVTGYYLSKVYFV